MSSKIYLLARWKPRKFGAAQAERITGVSQHIQRDWRRREIIGRKEEAGRVQYVPEDMARLALIQALSRAGLPLAINPSTLHWGTLAITNAALRVEGAVAYAPSVPPSLISATPDYYEFEKPPRFLVASNFAAGPEGMTIEFLEGARDLEVLLLGKGLYAEEAFSVINFDAIGSKLARSAACPLFDLLELSVPPGVKV